MKTNANTKLPISVFIVAQDEEDRIAVTIRSVVDWVDEVIVVDSGSSDKTVEVARNLGARVFERSWPGYGPQKRFAEDQCRNRWVLNLDADEEVSLDLAAEIQSLFAQPLSSSTAFKVLIRDVYPHEDHPAKHAYTHCVVRLYNLDQGRYADSPIHDRVHFADGTRYVTLKEDVYHRSIRSLSHMVEKTNKYTDLQAETFYEEGRKINPSRMVWEFVLSFFTAYFKRGHIRRGWYGLILSHHYAYNRFMRIAKMWEKQIGKG